MLFSLVVPNLHSTLVNETIRSLELQEFDQRDFEVIVVGMDRHSLIQTGNLVHFDRSEHPLSPAAARNRGAKQAHGEILVFIDADCIADPNLLKMYAERFSDESVNVLSGGVDFERKNYWAIADNISAFHDYLISSSQGERQLLATINLAIRREVFENSGGFDERYPHPSGEDSDLSVRLRSQGYVLYFEPRAVVLHKPPRNSFSSLVHHSFLQGKYSIKLDHRYVSEPGLPRLLRNRLGVILFSPLIAGGVTSRIFLVDRTLRRYMQTFPAVFISKMAWCFGAASRPAQKL